MKTLLVVFILLTINPYNWKTFSQERDSENITLDKVLHSLEKIYQVKFSFNSEIIKDQNVKIPEKLLLEEVLKKIQSQTSLFFEKVNDRYYIIRNKFQNQNQLCIQLLDGETISPLEGASIKKKRKGTIVTSDDQGYSYISLHQSEKDTINIHFLGYQDKEFAISDLLGNEECRKTYLYQNNQELEEVLIQEYVTRGFSKEKLSGSVVLDPAELGLLPRLIEPDILKSVQFLPGIESTTEKASELFIRGSNSDQNLILWDGIKVYNSGHFFNLLSAFNPSVTESVTVSRGFAALRYDSRVGGIIDIKSKNKIPKDIGIGVGSNLTHIDTYLELPLGSKIGVILSGRKSITELIDTPTTDEYNSRIFRNRFLGFPAEDFFDSNDFFLIDNTINYQDYTLKIIKDFDNSGKLTASGFLFEDGVDNTTLFSSEPITSDPSFGTKDMDVFTSQNKGASLNWIKKWGEIFSINTNGYFTDTNLEFTNRFLVLDINDQSNILVDRNTAFKDQLEDIGGSISLKWNPSKKHTIVAGYDFSNIQIVNNNQIKDIINEVTIFENTINENNKTHAAYIEDAFNLKNNISLSLGVKGNYFSTRDRLFLEPKFGLEFSFHKDITAKITAERKHQVMDLRPVVPSRFFSVDFQSWILRTLSYGPVLIGDQIGTGILINKKNWFVELESYYKQMDGVDIFNAIGDNDTFSFGTSRTFGADLLIKKKIDQYSTWITYAYIDQKLRLDDREGQFTGPFDITHNFSWIHSYHLGGLEFSLGWNIKTGLPYTPTMLSSPDENGTSEIIFGEVNSRRLATYHRLDFSTSYRFNLSKSSKWRGKIALSLINLYDRKNALARRAGIRPITEDGALNSDILSLGFTPNISIRTDF
ncbi:TonB-dependent receptor plug domain-containing protein [Aquimarina sp. RZ0]|uniref:TonB-dependent receptor plug domain-containing protein n=1 Tax=Aquimarina sp. RZ0 TaxID=2607730 RepID=UPI0011F20831|nr:TonB-dependent receptor plug domain-containing protein [Aquimarina sp. RZ0]KAA1245187.1 TonB-dependent receptor plug domain-containing protein [Aquimarina sp. RZ0]